MPKKAKMVMKKGLGGDIGRLLGNLGSQILPIPGVHGGDLGGFLGSLLPFKRGGRPMMARGGMAPMPARKRGGKTKKK